MFNLLGPLTTAALALYACLASNLFSEANQWLPRIVDAIFAALTTIVSISLVVGLDSMIQFKLFDGKMMSSAVVFCTNPTPPSPHAFIVCSSASFCAGVALHFLGTMGLPPDAVAVGIHVLFAKLSGCNFSSAVGLTAFVGKGWSDDSWAQPLHFLVATWLLGHALLFALAHVAAVPRRRARLYLTRRQWKALMTDAVVAGADATGGGRSTTVADADAADADAATTRPRAGIRSTSERRERLRELFARYDTSGDGRIDATEFRVTLRALAGVDVPLADCEATVRARAFWRLWTPPRCFTHMHIVTPRTQLRVPLVHAPPHDAACMHACMPTPCICMRRYAPSTATATAPSPSASSARQWRAEETAAATARGGATEATSPSGATRNGAGARCCVWARCGPSASRASGRVSGSARRRRRAAENFGRRGVAFAASVVRPWLHRRPPISHQDSSLDL